VSEFTKLRIESDTANLKSQSFTGEKEILADHISLMQSEMIFNFELSDKKIDSLGIILENRLKERFIVGYSTVQKKFYIDRREAGNSEFSKEFAGLALAPYTANAYLKLHLLVDASSVELFVDDGKLVMTSLTFPSEKFTKLKLFSKGGTVLLSKSEFHGIRKIWP
jgi:fructan beta-fructosidase